MKRFWPLFALLLVAATPPDEARQFRVAQAAFEDKLYDVAERQFSEFLQKYPRSDRADNAQYLLGQAQLNLGKWEVAVRTFQEALALWPDKRPDAIYFWIGEAYSRGGRFAEAEVQYNEVVEKYPHSSHFTEALYGLAFVQFKQRQFAKATASLDKLAKAQPKPDLAVEADLLRAQLLLAQNEFVKAEAILSALIQKAPNTRAFYRAHLWQGESLSRHGQLADALTRYAVVTDAFKTKPNKPVDAQLAAEAWFSTGWTQWQMGNFADAAESFSAVLTVAPAGQLKRDALLKLAEASVHNGKIADGVTRLKEFLQAHADDPLADEVQLAIGDLLFSKSEPAAALVEYVQLVNTYTNSPALARGYTQAGWCAWQAKKLPESLTYFEKALPLIKDASQAIEVQFKIADVHFALGQFKEAVATYQQLIHNHPQSPALDRALFQLGEAYRQLRDPEGVATAFDTLVKKYPTSELAPQAQYNLGQLLSSQDRADAARAAYATVVSNFPSSVWASNAALAVGESYDREDKFDQAIAEFDKLTVNGLETGLAQQAFYSRGLGYARTGKRDKTLADFLEFLKAHPQAPLAPNVQDWIAHEYLRQRDYLKAQAQFQSLAETYPASTVADAAMYFAGSAAYARQDYKSAVELYEALVKKFPQSSWRCKARFGQGDALTELGQFDDALLVFESLTKEFPDCALAGDAVGRKGDCQFTLGRYDDALVSYRRTLDLAKDAETRNHALFNLGRTYESQKKPDEALQQYAKALYEATAAPASNEPPEHFWSCKAALAAAGLEEQRNQWRESIVLYDKLAEHCPDLKPLVEDRIRKIKTAHPETLFDH